MNGVYGMNLSAMKKVTIYDISQALNISASTVSRALNDSPRIPLKTKEKIVKAARDLNYHHNKNAAQLKTGRSFTVGIVVPFIHHNVFSGVIQAIEKTLAPLGFTVVICQTYEKAAFEINHVRNLLANQVECIFIVPSKETNEFKHFEKAHEMNIPLIFFERKVDMRGINSVTTDNFEASYKATEHLIQQGCTRIAHFLGNQDLEMYRDRFAGYSKALSDHGLTSHKDWIARCDNSLEEGKNVFQKIWKQDNPIDAIVSPDDQNILGAYLEMKKRSIKVPEDIALIGFSNEVFAEYIETPFSTIFQDPLAIGKNVAEMFLRQVNSTSKVSITENMLIKAKLMVRASSQRRLTG